MGDRAYAGFGLGFLLRAGEYYKLDLPWAEDGPNRGDIEDWYKRTHDGKELPFTLIEGGSLDSETDILVALPSSVVKTDWDAAQKFPGERLNWDGMQMWNLFDFRREIGLNDASHPIAWYLLAYWG